MSALQDALMEADRQTQHEGRVWQTLRRFAAQLDRLQVPYAVVGGLALQHYGIERSTQHVDVLIELAVTLRQFHDALIGHGYLVQSPGSRHLRDEVTRVRIEFLIAGEYPGDGKPKPVQFPRPAEVGGETEDGIRFVDLRSLIEMKLASARSATHRIKDRADVLELIHHVRPPAEFAESLDPYVRDDYLALTALPPPSERD